MPLIVTTNLNQNSIFALWKITEPKQLLQSQLDSQFKDDGLNKNDNLHWLASRVLLSALFSNQNVLLSKDEFNKPSLFVNAIPFYVSISHSYAYAAVIVNSQSVVAVDIEKIDNRMFRVAHKFRRADEFFGPLDLQSTYLTVIWSAKETLYKHYATKGLDFLANLRISSFEYQPSDFFIEGTIQKDNYKEVVTIKVMSFEGYIITVAA